MQHTGSGSKHRLTAANGGAGYTPNIIHLHGTHVAMIFRRFCPNPLDLTPNRPAAPNPVVRDKGSDEHGKKA